MPDREEMSGVERGPGARRLARAALRGAIVGLLCLVAGALLAALALAVLERADSIGDAVDWLWRIRPYVFAVHFALIGNLWWHWAAILEWFIRGGHLPQAAREPLLQRRDRWIAGLLAIELVMAIVTRGH